MKGTNYLFLNQDVIRKAVQRELNHIHIMEIVVDSVAEVMGGEYEGYFCIATSSQLKDDLTHFQEKK